MFAICVALFLTPVPDDPKSDAKEALRGFQELIGPWRATGEPVSGSSAEKARGFWKESINWVWKFKGDDAWLVFTIDNGKYFKGGELRFLPTQEKYRLTMFGIDGGKQIFEGKLSTNGRKLVAERVDVERPEDSRLTLSLVGDIRFQYSFETRPKDRKLYTKVFQVGATREGESLAGAAKSNHPECVVSGGLGTIRVTHKGETYYVCCTGCLEAFKDDPEKYIKEFKEKKAKK